MNIINAHFRHICYNKGIILNQWLNRTNVELLKEPNNYKVHQLRTIVLVEADFNINCKMLGRRVIRQMLEHSTDSQWNATEQYGSKTGHLSQDLSLNTQLVDDIMRLTHSSGTICSNDAKNCYDCISHAVLVIALC